jgi:hypothetical protein
MPIFPWGQPIPAALRPAASIGVEVFCDGRKRPAARPDAGQFANGGVIRHPKIEVKEDPP